MASFRLVSDRINGGKRLVRLAPALPVAEATVAAKLLRQHADLLDKLARANRSQHNNVVAGFQEIDATNARALADKLTEE